METQRAALGVILGGGVGLFVDALLIFYYRAPIVYLVVFTLGLILIGPLVLGVGAGIAWVRAAVDQPWSWPALLLLAAVVWPTAVALPFVARIAQLRLATPNRIPVYPDAVRERFAVRLGDNENTSDRVHVVYVVKAESLQVLDFYRSELTRRNWEEGPAHFIERRMEGTPYWFRPRASACCRSIHIRLHEPSPGGLRFEVVYEPEGLFGT